MFIPPDPYTLAQYCGMGAAVALQNQQNQQNQQKLQQRRQQQRRQQSAGWINYDDRSEEDEKSPR